MASVLGTVYCVLTTDVYLSAMNINVDNVCIVYTVYNAKLHGLYFMYSGHNSLY